MSGLNRCKTCAHWCQPINKRIEIPSIGICDAVVMYWDATKWSYGDEITRSLKPEYKGSLAFVQDASDYSASLMTLPAFGCVQWAAKAEGNEHE